MPLTVDTSALAAVVFGEPDTPWFTSALVANVGDCFSYAQAKVSGTPLLFKGDDFRRTDFDQVL